MTPARQEAEDEDSASVEEGPGGLVGLIASLSGVSKPLFVRHMHALFIQCVFYLVCQGEEGSDIGALIGALTGVITNLLGVRYDSSEQKSNFA